VIDQKTAPLGFELFARFDQLFTLTMQRAALFLFFSGHAHYRQRIFVALDKTIQAQAERFGVQ
jgi:hypothetical protein